MRRKEENEKLIENKFFFSILFIVVAIALSINADAQDFIIENKTSSMFIVNGTTGDIFLAPVFGDIGVGTVSPTYKLEVIGNVSLNNTLFVKENGKVGIGTSSPDTELKVVGDLNVTGTIYALENNVSTGAGGWTDDGSIVRLTTSTDLIGIGTSDPVEKLTVSGNGSYTGDLVVGGNLLSTGGSGNADSTSRGWEDDGTIVRLATVTDLVGIGTLVPTEKLVVLGNLSINHSAGTSNTLFVDSTNNRVGVGTSSPSHTLTVVGSLNVTGVSYLGDVAISGNNITTNEIVSKNGNLTFFNDTRDELMRITSTGKVGIGTTTPDTKLKVVGDLNVTGTIYALGNNASVGGGWVDDGNTVRLVTSSDVVNIGNLTTATTEKLHIAGNMSINGSIFAHGNIIGTDGTGTPLSSIGWADDGTIVRLATSTDLVGIGTTNPSYLLQVANVTNAVNLSGVLYINGSSGGIKLDDRGVDYNLTNASANTLYAASLPKGWINFDGVKARCDGANTGSCTFNNSVCRIKDSFNVECVDREGVGKYRIYWDRDFADRNYAVVMDSQSDIHFINGVSAGNVIARTRSGATHVDADPAIVSVIAFGNQ